MKGDQSQPRLSGSRKEPFSLMNRSSKSLRHLRPQTQKRADWIDDSSVEYHQQLHVNTNDNVVVKKELYSVVGNGDTRKKSKHRERNGRKLSDGGGRRRKSRNAEAPAKESPKIRPDRAGENFPDIVAAMRRACYKILKVVRKEIYDRFKTTQDYQRVGINDEAFWLEAVCKTPHDWSSFLGLPMSGYNLFFRYASAMDYGTYLCFITAARELESFENQSGDYVYLLKFYEIFTTFVDVNVNFEKFCSSSSSSLGLTRQEDSNIILADLSELRNDMGEDVVKELEAVHARYFKSSLDRFLESDDDQDDLLIFEASPRRTYQHRLKQSDDSTFS